MSLERPHLIILIILGIISVGMVGVFLFGPQRVTSWEMGQASNSPSIVKLTLTNSSLLRQSRNACGIYAAYAAIRVMGENHLFPKTINPNELASAQQSLTIEPIDIEKTIWRLPNGYILPSSLASSIQNLGYDVGQYTVSSLNDTEKLSYLSLQLTKSPVIILGRKDGYLHYVTMLGFDHPQKVYYIYDSLLPAGDDPKQTVDQNGDEPGNSTWSEEEVLKFWNDGNFYGLYKNYLLVIRPTTRWQ